MLVYNATKSEIEQALIKANEIFEGNLKFKNLDERYGPGKKCHYTVRLGVYNSRGPGGRWNYRRDRRVASACWHAHGIFFDRLPPQALIVTNWGKDPGKLKIHPGDEWNDMDVGSMAFPAYMSDLCDCEEQGLL